MSPAGRIARRIAVGAALAAALPIAAPQLLAFPYSAQVGGHRVRSVDPIAPAVIAAVHAADRRVAASALGGARRLDQPIFLTGGGWRWQWLAARDRGALALTRAVNDTVLINRLDASQRLVLNGRAIGGQRGLEGVIAHELTHGAIRAHFGRLADLRYPRTLVEGYCDHVSGGGTLSDAEAQALQRAGTPHPALLYWRGRKQVEAVLAQPGMTVDRMFAERRD